MKKCYLSTVFFFAIFIAQAQIVNIPDVNFKNVLTNMLCVDLDNDGFFDADADLNNDGQIQVSEALAVTNLLVSDYYLVPVNNTTGLEAFTNVTKLRVNGFSGTTLDLTPLVHLETLSVDYNNFPMNINVSNLTSLTSIICANNFQIISFNLSGLVNLTRLEYQDTFNGGFDGNITGLTGLQYLECKLLPTVSTLDLSQTPNLVTLKCPSYGLGLTSLDLSGLAFLKEVDVSGNQLTALNTNGLPQIEKLNCGSNNLTALNVGALTTLKELDCSTNQITTLDVTNLLQLTVLRCTANLLQTLAVENLTNLLTLECSENQLSQLGIENLTNLTTLTMAGNNIASINVNTLIHLIYLEVSSNPINTLDVSTLSTLQTLRCANNGLTSLNLNQNPQVYMLDISGNQLSTIDLSGLPDLWFLHCHDNLFTTLDFSANTNLGMWNYNPNPNLELINVKNGKNEIGLSFFIAGCPNLSSICADEDEIGAILEYLTVPGGENIQVNSYCTFTPGGIYNTIAGTQTYDADNNGCTGTDPKIPLLKVVIDDGTQSGATFTNATGNYFFLTQAGTYVLTPVFENPYFTISPSSATITFGTVDSSTQTQNFCISPLGIHNDVEISILPISGFNPGFDSSSVLVYKNKGNQIQSGNIALTFDDAVLDFVNANPSIDSQSINQLSWNYTNLYPFETRYIYLNLNLNGPMEVPPVNIDDLLNFTATINPIAGDETPEDNIFALSQTVVGSFDPNDKTCLEGDSITPEMVGGYLHYLIRFQNSGTAAAQNVVIKDIIDTTKFDMASLQLTSSSHPQVTKITGNKVEFQFENINLPAEIDDAPGSNGYVAFKIKTKNNLVIGNSVSNKADIFFDYNFPIETNTATSTVALLGVNTFENTSVNVTPNPTKNIVHITSKGNITSVQLFDVQGRVLETITANDEAVDFDLSQKSSGFYFVKISTIKGIKVEKIIKE